MDEADNVALRHRQRAARLNAQQELDAARTRLRGKTLSPSRSGRRRRRMRRQYSTAMDCPWRPFKLISVCRVDVVARPRRPRARFADGHSF